MKEPTYLGDSVYVQYNAEGFLVLTTSSLKFEFSDNIIFMEPQVVEALLKYLDK